MVQSTNQPDIKKLQIWLNGFLGNDAATFCKELWKLCLGAQESKLGVAPELVNAKKQEMAQEKVRTDQSFSDFHVLTFV